MKKLSFLLLVFSLFTTANAQIVNIPDAIFKTKLLEASTTNNLTAKDLAGNYFKIDANNDGEIQESEALNVSYLDVNNSFTSTKISDLTGIENFRNLKSLDCKDNQLTSLNVSGLTNLKDFLCQSNGLTSLNVTGLTNLELLACDYNQLTSLNVTGLTNLKELYCNDNQLSSLGLTGLVNLIFLDCGSNKLISLNLVDLINLKEFGCGYNFLTLLDLKGLVHIESLDIEGNQLTSLDLNGQTNLDALYCSKNDLTILFIKNTKIGFDDNFSLYNFEFSNNINLQYICSNEKQLVSVQKKATDLGYTYCVVNSYCSFVPGGTFYTILGNQKLDSNTNGCDGNDIIMPNLKYTITNGTTVGNVIVDPSGNYSIPVQAGTHTINPVLENPTYFTVSPTTVNITFPTQTSPFTQNFCITPNGVHPDLEVTLLPLQPARPGFDAKYNLVYKNKGNTIQSGSVNLTFNDAVLDLIVANPVVTSQTLNNLSWNFTNLLPFETREITFTMNVNSPMEIPAVIIGDILNFGTTIASSATDETPTDNTFTFNQIVVGSYDPNDKTCLEGNVITPNLIGQYVHYTIRFENTGTFAAENVVVKDMIDLSKFDISTLVPTSASHSYTTRISEGNKVEFIFENINLPFDDANNDGYIAFKIKTKPTLVVNDSFSNEASIFFDYNFPIVTNKATSTFKTLGTPDFDFDRYFSVYPNPATTVLNITSKESINTQSIQVYNTLGQLVIAIPNAEKVSTMDVSNLKSGNYFIQIKTDKGSSTTNFIKK